MRSIERVIIAPRRTSKRYLIRSRVHYVLISRSPTPIYKPAISTSMFATRAGGSAVTCLTLALSSVSLLLHSFAHDTRLVSYFVHSSPLSYLHQPRFGLLIPPSSPAWHLLPSFPTLLLYCRLSSTSGVSSFLPSLAHSTSNFFSHSLSFLVHLMFSHYTPMFSLHLVSS